MFRKVLIANRGVIACRILRTLRRMGIESVAVYSEADADSLHVVQADRAEPIGPAAPAESYLSIDAMLGAARAAGAQAVHPGYGFLSESAAFAQACESAGLAFIGPTPQNIRAFGLKHTARELARAQGVALTPGSGLLRGQAAALDAAERIGYPVMLKSSAGGGGIGMRVCEDPAALREGFDAVARIAASNFGDPAVFLERCVRHARHVEVQIFGDGCGHVIALGERDCSLQRRHQKVIEETPAPDLPEAVRGAMLEAAMRLGRAVAYRSAGTVEFLFDAERGEFFFLEVNTRLQVEHGVTEQVFGVDLVEWMVRGAAGDFSPMRRVPQGPRGVSIQARLYAEDPGQDCRPSSGLLTQVEFAPQARVESGVAAGSTIGTFYDPMLAKLIVTAPDRAAAVQAMQQALDDTQLAGVETNLRWLRQIVRSDMFREARLSTRALAAIPYRAQAIRVVAGGLATTVQDYPGRIGYWSVGVPPSGPMDTLAFRLGNRLLGNPQQAAGLEITAAGPTLLFERDCVVCLTGAAADAALDGRPVPSYAPLSVAAGSTLKIGAVPRPGVRAYLLLRGGLDVPEYLGSRSTFTLGGLGGPAGRALVAGDALRVFEAGAALRPPAPPLPAALQPALGRDWTLNVMYGPQGAPDFFTEEDVEALQAAAWRVHYNSSRTGVRLIGPKPRWARRDGGEAGLHPSNIHDNAYAIGAVDFTGDMPIILGPDGPSLGGFVCPFVVVQADLWKLGQLAPQDIVRLRVIDLAQAVAMERRQDALVETLQEPAPAAPASPAPAPRQRLPDPVLARLPGAGARPQVTYRRQGDRNLLVEYGPIVLDLELRLRVHALMLELQALKLPGVLDITPGIRSLQVHYDARLLPEARVLRALADAEERLGTLEHFEIPSRVVHLPLSWRDPAVEQTIRRYMASVRDDAPWCPDNIEFIRRVNGLASAAEVRDIVFGASYLVLGLGDVYLGAPVATPVDPRHRLVTTKYNPARTWTPPNVVGIGGAYLCIYGMEGPGGYQLFGRTIQVWDTYRRSRAAFEGKPWLLRFFDQIRFFPVEPGELEQWRREFPAGRRELDIREEKFRLADYRRFIDENRGSIEAFQAQRRRAFDAEREQWEQRHEFSRAEELALGADAAAEPEAIRAPQGTELVEAPLGGSVWKVHVQAGDRVRQGDSIAAIEAMKMECQVTARTAGVVRAVYVRERQVVTAGAPIAALQPTAAGQPP